MRRIFCCLLALLAGGCAAVNPYYDASKAHHTPEGFKNNYAPKVTKSRAELLRWLRESYLNGLPKPPEQPIATQAPDLQAIHAYATVSHPGAPPSQPSIT